MQRVPLFAETNLDLYTIQVYNKSVVKIAVIWRKGGVILEQKQQKKGRALDIFRSPYARKFIGKYKWSYLIGIIVLIFIDVLQTEVPLVVGGTLDQVAEAGFTADMIWQPVIKLAAIAITVFLGRIIWRWFIFGSARKIERDMRNELYAHLQTLPASYFHKHNAG